MKKYFISGIGTGVGKTFASAVLTEALQADYWKPVQCGTEDGTDTERVKDLISNSKSVFHKEAYCFKEPASPHLAALLENEKIRMEKFILPETNNNIIIEGAGGLMVPLNDHHFVIDIAKEVEAEIILVCRNYLGCINHSLLSIDYLLRNEFEIKGIVLMGNFDKAVKSAIVNYSELPVLAEIQEVVEVNKEMVIMHAQKIDLSLF
jgi:dethiobiotin synthetase